MKSFLRGLAWAAVLAIAVPRVADAQFTSTYSYVNIAGTFNGFNTLNPNMMLISNGIWMGYADLPAHNPLSVSNNFLFATPGFSVTWKESNQTDFSIPIVSTSEVSGTSDIIITGNPAGTYRFQLDEVTRYYTVDNVTPGYSAGELWVNEFHYDNTGTDSLEHVEVAGVAGTVLTNYQIILYRGAGTIISTTILSGTLPNQQNGFGAKTFFYAVNGLPNGDGTGIALCRRSPTSVVDFVSYGASCTAIEGPAAGMTSLTVQVEEGGGTPVGYSLQLMGTGARSTNFFWVGPSNSSPDAINVLQIMQTGVPPASITFTNLVQAPLSIFTGDTVSIDVDIIPLVATNVSATVFYRFGSNGLYKPLPMSRTNNHHRTINPIPVLGNGGIVQYYVFANYTGTGTGSPDTYPANAPTSAFQYAVTRVPAGAVWINEINATADSVEETEYVELAGKAGYDISGWQLLVYTPNSTVAVTTATIPGGSVLPNDTAGYGFYVFGESTTPNVNLVFTNLPTDNLPDQGTLRLANEFGVAQYTLAYKNSFGGVYPSNIVGATQIGGEDNFFEEILGLSGTGSTYGSFAWATNLSSSVGAINAGQTLTGGNTNPLPPVLICPSDLFFNCASAVIPTANVASIVANGLCGTGGVTVTWVTDVVNNGTACFGNPKVITRTYKAVSDCATTTTCSQVISVEDKTPPVLICDTSALVNAGFEFGDFTGWTLYGNLFTNIGVASIQPRSGFRHAIVRGTSSSTMLDGSGSGFNGLYLNNPTRAQAGATTGTGFSVTFNGSNQYAEVPYSAYLNQQTFSFALWAKAIGSMTVIRTPLASRDFSISTVSGYFLQLSTSNTWQFWTGDGQFWNTLQGPVAASGQWAHVVGTLAYQSSNILKQLWINGALVGQQVITNFSVNSDKPLRLAAGETEHEPDEFFRGQLDDVRLYDYALSTADVATLYNNGKGGLDAGEELANWKMDEAANPGVSTSGFFQALSGASSGQIWSASAWALIPETDPMKGANRSGVTLQYLNSTGGVLTTYTSLFVSASTPSNTYIHLTARGAAPTNTASARLSTVFLQDAVASGGVVFYDDAVLSTLVIDSLSNSCPTMPNLMSLVTATDSCSSVTVTQTPAAGATLTITNTSVRFVATDACGLATTVTLALAVFDEVPPTIFCAAPITSSCLSSVPAPTTNSILAVDNCGPAPVTFVGATTNAGLGCVGNPILITRIYQATDLAGNASFCTQLVTVADTNPPALTCTLAGPLGNTGFETGTFSSWNTFGPTLFVESFVPKTGTRHAKIFGQFHTNENFTGFYQDLPARSGQVWRASLYMMTATNDALGGNNRVDIKLEFLGPSGFLDTKFAPLFNASTPRGVYLPFSVSGVAPSNCTIARFTVVFVQQNDNAGGSVYIDDMSLALDRVSTATNSCQGVAPDLSTAIGASDCGTTTTTQSPPAGVSLNRGVTNIAVYTRDACGNSSTCQVTIAVLDDVAPQIVSGPANVTVPSTNSLPPVDTNAVVATDNCSVRIVHDGDAVSATNPLLVITRTYRAIDSGTNSALYKQLITVSNSVPTAPTNVLVVGVSVGTNIVVRSLGTNTWSVAAEFTTNLPAQPQTWLPMPASTNQFAGGTNVTSFNPPVTNSPVIIRVKQTYP